MKRLLPFLMVFILVITACSPSPERLMDQGGSHLNNGEYRAAIDIFRILVETYPDNYDARKGLIGALIGDNQLKNADLALEDLYSFLLSNDREAHEAHIEDIVTYVQAIRRGDVSPGPWYEAIEPPQVSLEHLPDQFEVGQFIELVVPKGAQVYYTFDGPVSDTGSVDQAYTEPLLVNMEGKHTLSAVAVSGYGISSPVSSHTFEANDYPVALEPSLAAGTYEGPVTIEFPDFWFDAMDLYYTTDGSDPLAYGIEYNEFTGISLTEGDYELRAIYFDYETQEYSWETSVTYTVENPYSVTEYTDLTMAVWVQNDLMYNQISGIVDDINQLYEDVNINCYEVEDLETLVMDLEMGYADLVYGPALYVENLAVDQLIAPVTGPFAPDEEDYFNDALMAGYYEDNLYSLPVTISPNMMLYYNREDLGASIGNLDIDTWEQVINAANEGRSTYNFLYPEDGAGEWLFGFYLGFGGTIDAIPGGGFDLDEEAMVKAMDFAYELPNLYGLGFEGMDFNTYMSAVEDGSATLIYGDMYHLNNYDGNYAYTPAGAMPLPGGGFTGAVNLIDGLMVSQASVNDSNKVSVMKLIYNQIAFQDEANYIAGYSQQLPAVQAVMEPDNLYLLGMPEDYEHAVNNNVTLPYTYELTELFVTMSSYMNDIFYGVYTSEEAAGELIEIMGYQL